MIHYYINPKTRALIMLDPDEGEIFVVERIEKVRVMTGSDIRLADFEGPNSASDIDGPYRNHNYDPATGRAKRFKARKASAADAVPGRKQYACKNCGALGHTRKTCPTSKADEPVEAAA